MTSSQLANEAVEKLRHKLHVVLMYVCHLHFINPVTGQKKIFCGIPQKIDSFQIFVVWAEAAYHNASCILKVNE